MPGRSFQIIYPNGDFEIDASGQHAPPDVGDTIRRKGKLWRVTQATGARPIILRVEPADVRTKDGR